MRDRELKQVAAEFRRGMLGKRAGDMFCAVVCYPLQGLLSALGVELMAEEVMLKQTNHVFLRLPDGRVLDPTADQFGGPRVYLGKPMWFHENEGAEAHREG